MPISCASIHSSINEFQRNYIYQLSLINPPAAVVEAFPQANQFVQKIDVYNEKAVFPDRKTNPITIKWCGEFFEIPGTDATTRNYEFTFYDDQQMWVYDFFSACKDLTGNDENHASVIGPEAKFDMAIAKVSVDKKTITAYRKLIGCRVYGVKCNDMDKSGDTVSKLSIEVRWDRNEDDVSMRGTEI